MTLFICRICGDMEGTGASFPGDRIYFICDKCSGKKEEIEKKVEVNF